MADAENGTPLSKKRAAGREISKDDPGLDDDEESSEEELGTFKKASDEVLATRRMVKVRRQAASSVPSSNPFAGIRLVPTKAASETPSDGAATELEAVKGTEGPGDEGLIAATKDVENENGNSTQNNNTKEGSDLEEKEIENITESKTADIASDDGSGKETLEGEERKSEAAQSETADKDESKEKENLSGGSTNFSAFQQLSGSKNAFTGFTGTGFSNSSFSFTPISNDGTASSVPPTGLMSDKPLFGFGISANGSGSLFGNKDCSLTKSETSRAPSLQEIPTETGEENERVVFSANSALFEFLDGGWKERGRGEVKVNVSTTQGSKARLVMRSKGNYRLILNASLYSEMKLTYMDKKGITFACINSNGEGTGTLSTFALKFRDSFIADEFHAAVTSHKAVPTGVLKTPENSPH